MKLLSVVGIVFLLAFTQARADIGVLHVRPVNLELPPTWTFDGAKRPIEGSGPDGEKVLISILRKRPRAASELLPSAEEMARSFADGPMKELAAKAHMVVVRPVGPFPAAEGKAAYSAGSQSSGIFGGKSYFVQYLLAAPGVIIYFTFEGKGEAEPAMQRFDAFFATQKWDE